MTDATARVLHAIAALLMRLPWRMLVACAGFFSARTLRRNGRSACVARRNLELAYPDRLPAEREGLVHAIVHGTAQQALETFRFWTRPHAENLALIREVHGAARLDAAIAAGRGVIIAAPHYGNWELLNQWLAARTPLAVLYAPPESKVGEAFLQRVRAAHGDPDRVTQVRAEASAVRELLRRLKAGGVVGILPDQQPKQGDGEFAPFFDVPALTMTLLGRLAAKTGARVVVAYCERIDARGPGYALHLEDAPEGIDAADPAVAVAALNTAVERVARRDPAQYQWTYKRYSLRPPGGGEDNPYWPDCY
ncbi:lauroyl acyltransferase [Cognatilysobacter bugurensis]|uniref:Lipid A biosynthesis lauroyl acyltransferase n=1 Tax=Cognatilysobacter bugurensis TaxID=543356 RepID=A0A918T0C8_9GAMM|nr:lauroyl acyltransferase [Lysobacter bugurensis]GHA82655.1 lipid A biosynthesis lauroyl acyltransferase [Lysobacter bugurensis]